jgi:hypothetical protein
MNLDTHFLDVWNYHYYSLYGTKHIRREKTNEIDNFLRMTFMRIHEYQTIFILFNDTTHMKSFLIEI